MSIFLKAVQRINPSEPDEPKKWYPVQYTTKMVDESEVGGDGDTPVAQGGATPAAGRQEREAGRLGYVQHHPQHRGRGAQGRPHRPQREAGEHQLPARRRDESRHAEGGLRVAGQNRGRRHGFRRRGGRRSHRAGQ